MSYRGLKPPLGGPLRGKSQEVQTSLQDRGCRQGACEATEGGVSGTKSLRAITGFRRAFPSRVSPHGADHVQWRSAQGTPGPSQSHEDKPETRSPSLTQL